VGLGFGKLASEEGFSASAGSWDSSGLLLRIKDKVGFRRFAEERVARPLMESLLDTLDPHTLRTRILQEGARSRRKPLNMSRLADVVKEVASEGARVEFFRRLHVFEITFGHS